MTDIASLVFEIDSTQAVAAEKNLDKLAKTSERVETTVRKVRTASEQAGIGINSSSNATDRATKSATQHAQAMTQAEKVMRGALVTRGESITLLLRNAEVQAKVAADEVAAAKSAAAATTKAERDRQAAWKQSQAIQAEIMRERVSLARQAEQQEAAAAKSAADYALKIDRLRASLDPFAAIQTTLAQRTKLLDDAMRAGAITADQHAAMLSKVTKAATNGVLGLEKYSGGLKNGGQYATQFSYQLNDIVTGLMSGQKPMQVLAQQGGQLFQIFQMAAIEAGGLKAALRALYAEMAPLLAAFGVWIAILAAAGAAIAYLVSQHNKQKKAAADLTAELQKQRKELEGLSPYLFQTGDNATLAAEGQRNFDTWLKKTNISIAEQNKLLRENAINQTVKEYNEASARQLEAQKQFDKASQRGAVIMSAPGGFGVVAPVQASDPTANPRYQQAKTNLETAKETTRALMKRLGDMNKAPDKAFGDQTKKAASTPRDMTDERASQLDKEIATAKAAELQAQMALTKDVEARAAYSRQIAQAEADARQAELAGKIAAIQDDKGLSATKKQELTAGYEALKATEKRVADLKIQAIDQDLASQLLQAELASRQAANAYLDEMAKYAAEQATTDAERNAIELVSLKRRQDEEAYALAASNALKVTSGEISAMAAAEAEFRQRNLSIAEEEATVRKQRLASEHDASERDAARAQADIDLLQAQSDLSRSTTERRLIAEKILELEQAEERRKLELAAASAASTQAERDIAKARLAILDKVHAAQRGTDNERLQAAYREHLDAVNDVTSAFAARDWNGVVNGLLTAFANLKAAFSRTGSTMDKVAAVAAIAAGVGNAVGGTGGAALSGAASGAMAGFTLGGPIGAAIGGVLGGLGGFLGASKAKKQAKAQAAAQAAAEEARRQQTIADTEFGLNVALLRAQGEETKATNMEREKEIARLAGISQASADLQKQLWALEDAATASAAAAEKAAEVEAKRLSIQDQIDKLTLSDAELLAKTRARERAEVVALDPSLAGLIDKLYGLQDATAKAAKEAEDAAKAQEAADQAYEAAAQRASAYWQAVDAAAQEAAQRQAEAASIVGGAIDRVINKFLDLSRSLNDYAASLSGTGLSGAESQAYTKSSIENALKKGDYTNIEEMLKAYVAGAQDQSSTAAEYQAALAWAQAVARQAAVGSKGRADKLAASYTSSLPKYANGGSMVIGGNGGVDQNLVSVNGQPVAWANQNEIMSFTPAGQRAANDSSQADLIAEVRALRQQVADLQASSSRTATSNEKLEGYTRNVTQGGSAMLTEPA